MAHSIDEYWIFRNYCEKKNINLRYCDALIDFLKNHEGIYEPQDVSFPVLDKFLTYWFIRVYLNYNEKMNCTIICRSGSIYARHLLIQLRICTMLTLYIVLFLIYQKRKCLIIYIVHYSKE